MKHHVVTCHGATKGIQVQCVSLDDVDLPGRQRAGQKGPPTNREIVVDGHRSAARPLVDQMATDEPSAPDDECSKPLGAGRAHRDLADGGFGSTRAAKCQPLDRIHSTGVS